MWGELLGAGLGALSSLFSDKPNDAGKATMEASDQNSQLVNDFWNMGSVYLNEGADSAGQSLNEAQDIYAPLSDLGGKAGALYADALGINGAEGSDRATSAFQTGPGYDFAMTQGLDALSRTAASQGRLQSGQTGIDTMTYAQGLANQEWGNWLGELGNSSNPLYQGMAGEAGVLGAEADLATNTANSLTSLAGTATSGLTDANNQYAEGAEANYAEKAGLADSEGDALSGLLGTAGKALGGTDAFKSVGSSLSSLFGYL